MKEGEAPYLAEERYYMDKQYFEFDSCGERLIGDLYMPGETPRAAVILTGPLTSVKEQASGAYAKAMAERGFAALAFDHRYFGESSGQPRQFENPHAKIEDIRNGVSTLLSDKRISEIPVCAIGICAGGGYMAKAVSDDPRIAAFAGVAGVYSDALQTKSWLGDKYEAAIARAVQAETEWKQTGHSPHIPAVALEGGDVAMPLREAYDYYGTPRGAVANYTNSYAVQSAAYTLPFDAQRFASTIKVPTLIIHSEKALIPALAHRFFAALPSGKEELWLHSQGQIDFYDDPALLVVTTNAIANFFTKHI